MQRSCIKLILVMILQFAWTTSLHAEQWIAYSEPTFFAPENPEKDDPLIYRDKPSGHGVWIGLYRHMGIGYQYTESNVILRESSSDIRSKVSVDLIQIAGVVSDPKVTNWTLHLAGGYGEANFECNDSLCEAWGKQAFAVSLQAGIGYQLAFLEFYLYRQTHIFEFSKKGPWHHEVDPMEHGIGLRLVF